MNKEIETLSEDLKKGFKEEILSLGEVDKKLNRFSKELESGLNSLDKLRKDLNEEIQKFKTLDNKIERIHFDLKRKLNSCSPDELDYQRNNLMWSIDELVAFLQEMRKIVETGKRKNLI